MHLLTSLPKHVQCVMFYNIRIYVPYKCNRSTSVPALCYDEEAQAVHIIGGGLRLFLASDNKR